MQSLTKSNKGYRECDSAAFITLLKPFFIIPSSSLLRFHQESTCRIDYTRLFES